MELMYFSSVRIASAVCAIVLLSGCSDETSESASPKAVTIPPSSSEPWVRELVGKSSDLLSARPEVRAAIAEALSTGKLRAEQLAAATIENGDTWITFPVEFRDGWLIGTGQQVYRSNHQTMMQNKVAFNPTTHEIDFAWVIRKDLDPQSPMQGPYRAHTCINVCSEGVHDWYTQETFTIGRN